MAKRLITWVPPIVALWVWFSSLSFVPVPWPDDSAFYFVAKELFRWPPRWVMLPQAPFEPTYAIHNFNTMPLYPILIGLGRLIGIDGSFALKFWPLGAWAAAGSLLSWGLLRQGLAPWAALLVTLGFALDPNLRWAAVIVRPESLIQLCGVALVAGAAWGYPKKLRPSTWWDPVACLLAIGAYSHFNAVHLVAPVLVAYRTDWRRLVDIGLKTTLYLAPWLISVLLQPGLFVHQMTLQWTRLAVSNGWLDSVTAALGSLYPDMGIPEPWPTYIPSYASAILWIFGLIAVATLVVGLTYPLTRKPLRFADPRIEPVLPAAAWVASSAWLWHSKPEVWFTSYLHAAIWVFVGIAALALSKAKLRPAWPTWIWAALAAPCVALFAAADLQQAVSLDRSHTWHWDQYRAYIDCIDGELTKLEKDLAQPSKPFRVWAPTWPDITIELSRRHPHWELTRTNDFLERSALAVKHGHEVEAVVVAESLGWEERDASEPMAPPAKVGSLWLNWKQYFLYTLFSDPEWKPERRYFCQRGRMQAYLFMKTVASN